MPSDFYMLMTTTAMGKATLLLQILDYWYTFMYNCLFTYFYKVIQQFYAFHGGVDGVCRGQVEIFKLIQQFSKFEFSLPYMDLG